MKTKKFLIISIIALSVITYSLWPYLPFQIYYKGMASVLVLTAILIRLGSEKGTDYRYLCDFWFLLTLNNLIDELFFDPKSIEWNEYLFGAILLIHAIYQIRRGKIKRRNN